MKLSRVHGLEWLLGLGGVAVLAGLFLPWEGETTGFGEFGLFDLFLTLGGLAALLVPVVVASSRLTDVPVVWETLLWLGSLILLVVMLIKLIGSPEGGYARGFWLVLAGLVGIGLSGWRSVRREA